MPNFNPDDLLTARGRAKLKPRPQNAPYFRMLAKGQHIGFRPSESGGPGAWVLRYRHPDTGDISHVALGAFATYDEAKAEAESLLSKIIKGVDVKAKPTVKQACREYIEHKRQRAGDGKAEEYRERLERYMFFADDVDTSKAETDDPRRIGAIQLAKLRRQDVETWFASVSKGRAPATANRYFNDLRAALNLALKNSLVASDAAWQIDKHSNAERARVDAYLTKRERKMIIDSLNPSGDCETDIATQRFCQFLTFTGLRPGAVAALKVKDFDPRGMLLAINKDKAGGGRVIQLSDKAVLIAKSMVKYAAGPDDWLFRVPIQVPCGEPDSKGKRPLEWVIRPWNKYLWKDRFKAAAKVAADKLIEQAEELGKTAEAEELKRSADRVRKATVYVLRHSAISDMVESGQLSIHSIAKSVGTSVEMIERHYGHLSRKTREVLNSIGY